MRAAAEGYVRSTKQTCASGEKGTTVQQLAQAWRTVKPSYDTADARCNRAAAMILTVLHYLCPRERREAVTQALGQPIVIG